MLVFLCGLLIWCALGGVYTSLCGYNHPGSILKEIREDDDPDFQVAVARLGKKKLRAIVCGIYLLYVVGWPVFLGLDCYCATKGYYETE